MPNGKRSANRRPPEAPESSTPKRVRKQARGIEQDVEILRDPGLTDAQWNAQIAQMMEFQRKNYDRDQAMRAALSRSGEIYPMQEPFMPMVAPRDLRERTYREWE